MVQYTVTSGELHHFFSLFMVMQHEMPQQQFNKSNKHNKSTFHDKNNRSRMKKKIL